ncbi:alpha/beta hydrolase [Castellaniella sp.]|uniref:alpha/beta fold hydrolase n=1 Tax=Castellaniella sp. TaxID=1955812 RepID=UPI002AFF2079|nr:alpha/beta hydrolase [Castellaniella sp.]
MPASTSNAESPAWVLLHGLLCDADTWADFIGPLSRTGSVLAARLSGITSLAQAAEDVLRQIDGPVIIVGHSMGGRVALEMARQAPSRIRGLVLMNTGYKGLGEGELDKRHAIVRAARAGGIAAIAEDWLAGMITADTGRNADLMQRMRDMVLRSTVDSFAGQIQALIERPDASSLLPEIACPTLLMSGALDRWSPLSRHEDMAGRIAGAELRAIPDAGHMAPFEAPEACLEHILDWAARHRPTA